MYLCCSLNRSAAGKLARRLSLCVLVCVSCSPCVHIYEQIMHATRKGFHFTATGRVLHRLTCSDSCCTRKL
jgi:hypothetical protein